MMKQQTARALSIFKTFLKFGCFTFGGGWSIVAQMQKEYVEKEHWITDEELLDFTSVGRSTPGLMIGNVSILFGYHAAGIPGALAGARGGGAHYPERAAEAAEIRAEGCFLLSCCDLRLLPVSVYDAQQCADRAARRGGGAYLSGGEKQT